MFSLNHSSIVCSPKLPVSQISKSYWIQIEIASLKRNQFDKYVLGCANIAIFCVQYKLRFSFLAKCCFFLCVGVVGLSFVERSRIGSSFPLFSAQQMSFVAIFEFFVSFNFLSQINFLEVLKCMFFLLLISLIQCYW